MLKQQRIVILDAVAVMVLAFPFYGNTHFTAVRLLDVHFTGPYLKLHVPYHIRRQSRTLPVRMIAGTPVVRRIVCLILKIIKLLNFLIILKLLMILKFLKRFVILQIFKLLHSRQRFRLHPLQLFPFLRIPVPVFPPVIIPVKESE